jgi:hypothetical protein
VMRQYPAPPWSDVDAVRRRVRDRIEELRLEVDRLAWTTHTGLPDDDAGDDCWAVHALVMKEIYQDWPQGTDEAVAAEAAECGDLEPLANLLRPLGGMLEFGIPDEVNPAIEKLSPETWMIIVQFLTGQRNLKTGKLKGKRGPRKKKEEERRRDNPVHNAADFVPAVTAILQRLYPTKGKAEIKRRAIEVAAWLEYPTRPAMLERHLRRPPGDRRRIR